MTGAAKVIGPAPRRFSLDEIAAAFGVPVSAIREPDPFIAARKVIEDGDLEQMKAAVSRMTGLDPSCFEITEARPDLPGQFSATVLLSGTMGGGVVWDEIGPPETTVETCSTCNRRERLFESVDACRLASPGTCRFALRRVE